MSRKRLTLVFVVLISAVSLSWLTGHLMEINSCEHLFHQRDPDALLFTRYLEQSILKGELIEKDLYGCYPYEMDNVFPPFYLYFLFHFTLLLFALFPGGVFSPYFVVGMLPIFFTWLTAIVILMALRKLDYGFKTTMFCGIALLPGFAASLVSGYMKLDYDYLLSFLIWGWVVCSAIYQDSGESAWKICGSLLVALFIASWLGVPLFFFLVTLYCLYRQMFSVQTDDRHLEYASSTMLIGSLLNFLFIATRQEYQIFAIVKYSFFQPGCVLAGGAFVYFLKFGSRRVSKISSIGFFTVGLVILFLFFSDQVLSSFGFLFARDPVHARIVELNPIFDLSDFVMNNTSVTDTLKYFGWTIFLLPLFVFLPIRVLSEKASAALFRDWLVIMILMSLYQVRYLRWLTVGVGLYSGLVLSVLWQYAVRYIKTDRFRIVRLCAAFVPLLVLQNIIGFTYIIRLNNLKDETVEVYNWIKRNTPVTSGYCDDDKPEYSILSFWDEGNALAYYTQRPVAVNNAMMGYKTKADIFSSRTEADAFALCRHYGVRYIFISLYRDFAKDAIDFWPYFKELPEKPEYNLIYKKLERSDDYKKWFWYWLRERLALFEAGNFKTGSNFRVVYSSKNVDSDTTPAYLLYEVVEGAKVELPVTSSELSISLQLGVSSSEFLYKRKILRDPDGIARFVLPYSVSYKCGRITTAPFYKISYRDNQRLTRAKLFVSETDVLTGRKINVSSALEVLDDSEE